MGPRRRRRVSQPKRCEIPGFPGRDVYFLSLESAEDFPATLRMPDGWFVCLLFWDASEGDADTIESVASVLIEAGAAFIGAWGPDCWRVIDGVEEVLLDEEPAAPELLIRVFEEESIEEALWFVLVEAGWPPFCRLPPPTLVVEIGTGRREEVLGTVEQFTLE